MIPPLRLELADRSPVGRIPLAGGLPLLFHGRRLDAEGAADERWAGFGGWILPVQHRRVGERLWLGTGGSVRVGASPSEDIDPRRERHDFDADGRVVRICDQLTGRPRWQLDHGDDRTGLVRLTGGRHRWHVDHPSEHRLDVVTAAGRRVSLVLDERGRLASVDDGAGRRWEVEHDDAGRLCAVSDPRARRWSCTYDEGGITRLAGPRGKTDLVETVDGTARRLTAVGPDGQESSIIRTTLDDGSIRTVRRCCGSPSAVEVTHHRDGRITARLADGTTVEQSTESVEDPIWGTSSRAVSRHRITTPAGRSRVVRRWTEEAGEDATEVVEIDGERHEQRFETAARRVVSRSAAGRVSTVEFDALGRVTRAIPHDGPRIERDHDAEGRAIATSWGDQTVTVHSPDPETTIASDGAVATTIRLDSDGRRSVQILPDGRELTVHGGDDAVEVHVETERIARFTLDRSERTATTTLQPEDHTVTTRFDARGRVGSISDGEATVELRRGPDGLIQHIDTSDATVTYDRDTVGRVVAVSYSNGEVTRIERDGPLATAWSQEGATPARIDLEWAGMRPAGHLLWGRSAAIDRDADGAVLRAGPTTYERHPESGRATVRRTGGVVEEIVHDRHHRIERRTVSHGDDVLATFAYRRLDDGRLAEVAFDLGSGETVWRLHHDAADRLIRVDVDGDEWWAAAHDVRSNRVRTEVAGISRAAQVDGGDRLLRSGEETFVYDGADRLVRRSSPDGTTRYSYDGRGNLVRVAMPERTIEHVIDGLGNRTATLVDGRRFRGYVWQGDRLVGWIDDRTGRHHVLVHGADRAPDAILVDSGRVLALVNDHLGSPLLTIDAETGEVLRRLRHDPDGNVLEDTAPWLHPLGFTGGLAGDGTGLVHLGAREYDPGIARFTSRDPLLLAGGQLNFHAYAHDDPMNFVDPDGLATISSGGTPPDAVAICSRDFGVWKHGALAVRTNGETSIYGLVGKRDASVLGSRWGDQTADLSSDPSTRCEKVPDVDPQCVMDHVFHQDGSFKDLGLYGLDPGFSEVNEGVGPNICWNPVFEAIRNCGGNPYEHIPDGNAWDDAMAITYVSADVTREVWGTAADAYDAVVDFFFD